MAPASKNVFVLAVLKISVFYPFVLAVGILNFSIVTLVVSLQMVCVLCVIRYFNPYVSERRNRVDVDFIVVL